MIDMKSNFLRNKIGGALLGVSLLLGVGFATSAQAQDNRWGQDRRDDNYGRRRDDDRNNRGEYRRGRRRADDGYGNYGGSAHLRQTALNEGFNEGLKEGRNDRKKGDYSNYTDEKEFQKGTKSYNSRIGDRETYRRYFREAFSHGYADGYAGY
jgi:hypothetical protein